MVALQSCARQRACRARRKGHAARQRSRQDHQEAAQDLRHAARSFAGEIRRHHRGRQGTRHRQIRKAGRRRLRDHALDQSRRDPRQQGDDGDQGPQCHHHCGIARGPEDDDEDRRLYARGAQEDRRARGSGADPAGARVKRHDAGVDAGRRPRGRNRLAGQRAPCLFERDAGDRRRHRQCAGDRGRNRRPRRCRGEDLRVQDFR